MRIAKVDAASAIVNQLELKSTKDDVIKKLGSPDVRKAQIYENGQLEILYYKTWTQTAMIGIEYAAAFTPLYFYEGVLLMIGDQVMAQYLDPIATMNAFKNNFPSRQQIDVFIYDNR
ncbi:MAG: DUF3192 domain-containing protein [Candidatus Lokiarchaeota archaeon]|nr:DUF3192 domain-containing protein [Candidatus Lokiarchaeota archaeon]